MVHRTAILMVRKLTRRARRQLFEDSKWDHPLYSADKTPAEGRMKGLMKGLYPVTRTKDYLNQGIVFRNCIEVLTINAGNYEDTQDAHTGIRFASYQCTNSLDNFIIISTRKCNSRLKIFN